MGRKYGIALALTIMFCGIFLTGCFFGLFGQDDPGLPDDPVERAAMQGLVHSFRESAMWEIRNPEVLNVQPMVPTKGFVREHDPKEVYCVCIRYEARYKVPWATEDSSPWDEAVRNVLVIRTQGDQYMALRPSGICPSFCQ